MTTTSIEKSGAGDLVAAGETGEARRLNALFKQCVALSKSDLVPKALRGKPDNVFALALYGEQYSLSPVHSVQRIYIIEGTFEPKADVLAGIIMRAGHEVNWDEETETHCTVSIRRAGSDRWQQFTYTLDRARRAGALDIWVERKVKKPGDDWAKREVYVIGNDLGVNTELVAKAPEWAKALIDAGDTKRKDPWWTHVEDMLAAKVMRRAARKACSDVLLGLDDEPEQLVPLTPEKVLARHQATPPPEPTAAERPPDDDGPDDDEPTDQPPVPEEEPIEDADVVEQPPADPAPPAPDDELDPAAAQAKAMRRLMATCGKAFPETDAPRGSKTHRQKLLRRAAQFAVLKEHRSAKDLTAAELDSVEGFIYANFLSDSAVMHMRYEILDDDVVKFMLGDKSKEIPPAPTDLDEAA